MSDNDPGPHSMIYAQVEPEHIADVNWIMEGYEHLATVSYTHLTLPTKA